MDPKDEEAQEQEEEKRKEKRIPTALFQLQTRLSSSSNDGPLHGKRTTVGFFAREGCTCTYLDALPERVHNNPTGRNRP
jgi:hypothetical protein